MPQRPRQKIQACQAPHTPMAASNLNTSHQHQRLLDYKQAHLCNHMLGENKAPKRCQILRYNSQCPRITKVFLTLMWRFAFLTLTHPPPQPQSLHPNNPNIDVSKTRVERIATMPKTRACWFEAMPMTRANRITTPERR